MKKPIISVCALGGTICMSAKGKNKGVEPTFNANDLIDAVPGVEKLATLKTATLFALPSGSLKIENLLEVYEWAKNEVKNGSNGIVVTQGTDTLEESAFFLNLIWDEDIPFVITGAMKNPDEISADGPANILASIITAIDKNSFKRGVLVVLNNTIHSAKFVHKSNTFSLDTFKSINAGIQGMVIENEVKYVSPAIKRVLLHIDKNKKIPKVTIIQSYIGDNGDELEILERQGFEGIVISSFGAGHVSKDMMKKIENSKIPIIISSRTGSGITAKKTYGYYGSEITLLENGCIMSGWLNPFQARLLLIALLLGKKQKEDIIECFDKF
ncbi:asparaginase [Campylobacter ureolyticus]|jgi:L-asparaginase II|uniref:asparaginase n=1 Tax=Campylobacter ureolyticus TaxID=827 RepID=UPI0022B4507F|nr:asparaginase [Campylobacter ureolyticus]MCZ6117102.1 asparaginase [Campylobacter ureolyticus]